MRRTRWLFLVAILGIVILVGATYIRNKANFYRNAPAPPKPLEAGVDARSQHWTYSDNNGIHKKVFVQADSVRQIKEPYLMELDGVELHLFHKDGAEYDLVR